MAEATMREVVQRMRAENCRAALELREFQYAFGDLFKNVEQLAIASDEIHLALRDIGAPLGERTDRLSTHATQTVLAFRAVRIAVLSWNVAGATGSTLYRTAMHDVVARLRAEGSEAMLELRAFDASTDHLLQDLGLLAAAAGELHVAVQKIGPQDTIEGYRRLKAARERAAKLSEQATQGLVDFRALRAELARWNITGTDGGSNQPKSNGSAPPGEES